MATIEAVVDAKPMEELLALTGLDVVKQVALSVYSSVLADKRLRAAGKDASTSPEALNFAFWAIQEQERWV